MKVKKKNKNVIVALSGGIDSSFVCHFLLKQKYNIKAIHVKSWDSIAFNDLEGKNKECQQGKDYQDVLKIINLLKIDLIKLDLSKEYFSKVFSPFLRKLKEGYTPNPDILCNKYIKFGLLKQYVEKHYPKFIFATGHYANFDKEKNHLLKAKDTFKDQTYFLSKVKTNQFKNTIFPIGSFLKKDVRLYAKNEHLPNYNKKDSTGLCFIGKRHYISFLSNYIKFHKGHIINYLTKEIIGSHLGYEFYTIGQNKALNLGGQKQKLSILKKDIEKNLLYVAPINHLVHKKSVFYIENLNKIGKINKQTFEKELDVRIRHQGKLIKCMFHYDNLKIVLNKSIIGISPGQEAVFYDKNRVLGGGTIIKVK